MAASDNLNQDQFGYRGNHHAPNATSFGAPIHNPGEMFPDIDTHPEYYSGYGDKSWDRESHSAIKAARGNPEAPVTIHRAAPKGTKDINPGDWVSTSRGYAFQHGYSNLSKGFTVLSKTVPAKEVHTNGDYIHEWGWNPKQ